MPRLTLPAVLAAALFLALLVLLGQRAGFWATSQDPAEPPSTVTAAPPQVPRDPERAGDLSRGGPAASALAPAAERNPAPAGARLPEPPGANPVPPSALPRAPSGEPAVPVERTGQAATTTPVPGSTAHVPPQTPAAPVEAAPGRPIPPAAQGGTAAVGEPRPPGAPDVIDLRTGRPVGTGDPNAATGAPGDTPAAPR